MPLYVRGIGQLRDRRRDARCDRGRLGVRIPDWPLEAALTRLRHRLRGLPSRPATCRRSWTGRLRGSTPLPSRNSRQRWPTAAPWSTAASGRTTHDAAAGPHPRPRVGTGSTLSSAPRSHLAHVLWWGAAISGSSLEASTCSAAVPRSRCRSASASTDCSPSPASSARSSVAVPLRRRPPLRRRGEIARLRLLRLRLRRSRTRGDGDQFRHRLRSWLFLVYEYFGPFSGANIATSAAAYGRAGTDRRRGCRLIPGCGPRSCSRASRRGRAVPGTVSQRDRRDGDALFRYWPSTPGPPSSPRFLNCLPAVVVGVALPVGPRVQDGGVRVRL